MPRSNRADNIDDARSDVSSTNGSKSGKKKGIFGKVKSLLMEDTSKPAKPKQQTLTISQLQERDEEQRKRYEDWARRQRAEGRNVPSYAEYVRQKNTTAGLAGSQSGSKTKLGDHAGPSGMPSKQGQGQGGGWAPSLNPNSPQQPRPSQNGTANGGSGHPPSYNGPPSHNGPASRDAYNAPPSRDAYNAPPPRDAYNGPSGSSQSNGYNNTSPPKAYLPQRKPAAPQYESHNGSPKMDGIAPIVSPPPHSRSYSESSSDSESTSSSEEDRRRRRREKRHEPGPQRGRPGHSAPAPPRRTPRYEDQEDEFPPNYGPNRGRPQGPPPPAAPTGFGRRPSAAGQDSRQDTRPPMPGAGGAGAGRPPAPRARTMFQNAPPAEYYDDAPIVVGDSRYEDEYEYVDDYGPIYVDGYDDYPVERVYYEDQWGPRRARVDDGYKDEIVVAQYSQRGAEWGFEGKKQVSRSRSQGASQPIYTSSYGQGRPGVNRRPPPRYAGAPAPTYTTSSYTPSYSSPTTQYYESYDDRPYDYAYSAATPTYRTVEYDYGY